MSAGILMWTLRVAVVICLLICLGCGGQDECQNDEPQPPECQLASDGYFELYSLDMDVLTWPEPCVEFDGTVVEIPSTGTPKHLILEDGDGGFYRFKPIREMDWEKQFSGIQIRKNYHFILALDTLNILKGMKILDGDSLLYLASSHVLGRWYSCNVSWRDDSAGVFFKGTELEGIIAEQLPPSESKCHPRKVEDEFGSIYWFANLPMFFQYGEQSATLYHSQEAIFTTPEGDFLVHVLYSIDIDPVNFDDGDSGFSFYVRRLQK